MSLQQFVHEEEESNTGTPIKYVPLIHLYSATSPCITESRSSNVMSKKVKARRLVEPFDLEPEPKLEKRSLKVYCRRAKRPRDLIEKPSFFDSLSARLDDKVKEESNDDYLGEDSSDLIANLVKCKRIAKKRKQTMKQELQNLGIDSSNFVSRKSRETRTSNKSIDIGEGLKGNSGKSFSSSSMTKRWVELIVKDADPIVLVGLECKVYWPLDDEWYAGSISGYDPDTMQHQVEYDDGDDENLILSNERVKVHISREEMKNLSLKCCSPSTQKSGLDYDELVALAACFDDCNDLEPGDIIWAKLTGHAMWPAIVMNDSDIHPMRGLKSISGERSVSVQFFGTHDFARINMSKVVSFVQGLFASFHLKCKQTHFRKSLEEAKIYISEQRLPKRMLCLQRKARHSDYGSNSSDEEEDMTNCIDDEWRQKILYGHTFPLEIGDLRVVNLGRIVEDSNYFHDEQHIWPVGYLAERKFPSVTDPTKRSLYKMEVLRDPKAKDHPMFRVTLDDGQQVNKSTPTACWKVIHKKIKKACNNISNVFINEDNLNKSGSYLFGFSNSVIAKLIRELSRSKLSSSYKGYQLASMSFQDMPAGYRVDWKDLDKCSVCHMDEEYESNMFLQCDNCQMMVHARCFGELEPVDGLLWLCNLCRPEAPMFPPQCCLCPVVGGAMKATTDGRWAHLACAMWIPETCLSDVKKMEPIEGIDRIHKDRWKLLCSICGVSYGACIQCSDRACRVAYHPLCARAAGLCVELADEDRLHLMPMDEDEEQQCIRLLSFCKKHGQSPKERSPADKEMTKVSSCSTSYTPPLNISGCARSEPFDFSRRRGRREPEVLAAASLKRLYVENMPYLVGGVCQNAPLSGKLLYKEVARKSLTDCNLKLTLSQPEIPKNIFSRADRYSYMRETFRRRLAFGKSRIHGFGVFAKYTYRAGDMVIEYTGELVRSPIADIREHSIYNSLVGAGTYMFRIDDERVIDATRAGSIAHLINHSCEPNCYSRVITVNCEEHIIIFAKRDIKQWEELTYDYRFFSNDERLACYCGFPRCRGVVNDIEAEEQLAKISVPLSKLIGCPKE